MITALHMAHEGAVVSIVGSGPTATEYLKHKHDVSIGVNGAAKLGVKFDYFMCGDDKSPTFDWFKIDCAKTRVIAKIIAACDTFLYPEDKFNSLHRITVPAAKQASVKLPPPVWPHFTFMYRWFKMDRLKKDANYLMFGGTISCCAVQLAYMMGASKVILYGCGFNSIGQHYFYQANKPGCISRSQRDTMTTVLNEMQKRGMKVQIIGNTTLKQ